MLWGPTALEVPHRPSRTGQSGWNESLPAGNMQVKSSARVFPRSHSNVTDLQSVCHWIVTLGIIRAVQKLFDIEGRDEIPTTSNSLCVKGKTVVISSVHSMSVKKGRTAMQYARSPAKEHKDQFSLI